MKKKLFLPALVAVAMLAASCDSKLCYCYEATASGVYETEVYISTDSPCSSMSTSTRGCVESNERMDLGEIAYK